MEAIQTLPVHSSPEVEGQQPVQVGKDEEWQEKLSSLQDEHKLESVQQQQEHLEQLKTLQTQLLRELSSDMNAETPLPTQDLLKSKQQELMSPIKQDDKENILISSETSPEKNTIKITPSPSKEEYIPPPRTNPVVKHSPPQTTPRKQSPTRTSPYKILRPKSAWENEMQSPGMSTLSWTGPGTPHSSSRGDGFSRAALVAKHNKHVEDLKKYYESEITELQTQLEQSKAETLTGLALRRSTLSPGPVQRQLLLPSSTTGSPGKDISSSQLWLAQSENERLLSSVAELQGQLDNSERERHVLEGQFKRFQQHISEWQERSESSERLVSVLQERLESTRSQLHHQERVNGQLNSDLGLTTDELMFWKDQKLQDVDKLDQLFHEFDVLQEENQHLLSLTSDLKAQLEEREGEVMTFKSSLDKYALVEEQYQNTIRKLEDEVRHLEHVNNRLHSQTTHYDTSWPSDVSVAQHRIVSPQSKDTHSTNTPVRPTSNQPSRPRPAPTPGPVKDPATPQSARLTRRKWLESSIPGLLFGGTDEQPQPSSSSRVSTRTSPEKARPVRRSPRPSPGERERVSARPVTEEGGSVEDILRAVREGNVLEGKHSSEKKRELSVEERVREQLERVGVAERRLAELQSERERLEGALLRTPRAGARVTREVKQNQAELEQRLEQVIKEIGSVKMVLRKHHAFKK